MHLKEKEVVSEAGKPAWTFSNLFGKSQLEYSKYWCPSTAALVFVAQKSWLPAFIWPNQGPDIFSGVYRLKCLSRDQAVSSATKPTSAKAKSYLNAVLKVTCSRWGMEKYFTVSWHPSGLGPGLPFSWQSAFGFFECQDQVSLKALVFNVLHSNPQNLWGKSKSGRCWRYSGFGD